MHILLLIVLAFCVALWFFFNFYSLFSVSCDHCSMLFLDCTFLNTQSVFSNVHYYNLSPVVCRRVHVLFTLFVVCLRIVVSNIHCVVFLLCFSSSCVPYVASFSRLSIFDCPFVLPVSLDYSFLIAPSCCQFLWIIHFWLPLRVASFSGLSIFDCPFVLPVSLDYPFLIAPSCCQFLWIIHFWLPLRVASFSGLSIFDCPFGII